MFSVLSAKHYSKAFTCMTSLNLQSSPEVSPINLIINKETEAQRG